MSKRSDKYKNINKSQTIPCSSIDKPIIGHYKLINGKWCFIEKNK